MNGLEEATKGDLLDRGAGTFERTIEASALYDIVQNKKEVLAEVMEPELLNNVERLTEALLIAGRGSRKQVSESGINVTIPTGLSVPSLLSRGYSIVRRVVSPGFVFAEVALRQAMKNNAKSFALVASDPKMVDAMIDIVQQGDKRIPSYNAKISNIVITMLAHAKYEQADSRMETQTQDLGLDRFRPGER